LVGIVGMTLIGDTTTIKIMIITTNFVSINSISVGSEVLKCIIK